MAVAAGATINLPRVKTTEKKISLEFKMPKLVKRICTHSRPELNLYK